MEAFEVLIKSQSDGIRFDLYCRPVLIDNIRVSAPDFEEFIDRLRATPQGVVIDYAGYLEPDPERKPQPNHNLRITYTQVIETPQGVQLNLILGSEPVRGLFLSKEEFPNVLKALKAVRE